MDYLGMGCKRGKERKMFCMYLFPLLSLHLRSERARIMWSDTDDRDEDDQERVKRMVRSNNFTQQTNALDVDKHM